MLSPDTPFIKALIESIHNGKTEDTISSMMPSDTSFGVRVRANTVHGDDGTINNDGSGCRNSCNDQSHTNSTSNDDSIPFSSQTVIAHSEEMNGSNNTDNNSGGSDDDDNHKISNVITTVQGISATTQNAADEIEIETPPIRSDNISSSSLSLRYSQVCASVTSLFSSSCNNSEGETLALTVAEDNRTEANKRIISSEPSDINSNSSDFNRSCEDSASGNTCTRSVPPSPMIGTTTSANANIGTIDTSCHSESDSYHGHGSNISRHELDTFLSVGRLMQYQSTFDTDSSSIASSSSLSPRHFCHSTVHRGVNTNTRSTQSEGGDCWYENLKENNDRDNLSKVAEQVLSVIGPELNLNGYDLTTNFNDFSSVGTSTDTDKYTYRLRIEPPSLTQNERVICANGTNIVELPDARVREIVSLMFPEEFQCPLCKNLLVGSIVLDCGCRNSACCIQCLEVQHQEDIRAVKKQQHAQSTEVENGCDDGFIIIDWDDVNDKCISYSHSVENNPFEGCKTNLCPSCRDSYTHGLPCHHLDVAVLNAVRNACVNTQSRRTGGSDKITTVELQRFQWMYFKRMQKWGEEFYRRRKSELDSKKQMLLSKIISEQEAMMDEFKRQKESNAAREKCLFNNADIPLLAAVAFAGINLIIFRRWKC